MPSTGTIERCEHCGSIVSLRKITLYTGLISSLRKVYNWCIQNRKHEFKTSDIRDLLGQVNYTRFGDLVMFGGLVYKNKKANYGLNMERCREFLTGARMVPSYVMKNPVTGEITPHDPRFIEGFPNLKTMLDKEKQFVAEYSKNPNL